MTNLKFIKTLTAGLVLATAVYPQAWAAKCGTNCTYTIDDDGNVVVTGSGSVTRLEGINKSDIKTVTIGGNITSIENEAFYGAHNMTDVTIGDSVTNIGRYAFGDATSLQNVNLGSNVKTIGTMSFSKASNLQSIVIPESVETIGQMAFAYNYKLNNIKLNGNDVLIENNAFLSVPKSNFEYNNITFSCGTDCTANIDNQGNATFSGTGEMTTNDTLEAFRYLIKNAVVEEGITSVNALGHITNMISIVIPESVETIGQMAFAYDYNLTDITIKSENVEVLQNAFLSVPLKNINYKIGGTTEEFVLNNYPNSSRIRLFGAKQQWTISEALDAIQESRKRGYKPDKNTVILNFK